MFRAKAATTLQRRVICSLVSVSVEELYQLFYNPESDSEMLGFTLKEMFVFKTLQEQK